MNDLRNEINKSQGIVLILAYPFVLIILGVLINYFALEIEPVNIALPAQSTISVVLTAAILLLINHTWLMTSTEVTRARLGIQTPLQDDNTNPSQLSLKRRHNAHRNTTENTLYFVLFITLLLFTSPSKLAVLVWALCFSLGRLGYTYGYLSDKTGVREIFMSLNLLSLYGMMSYLLLAFLLA